MYRISGNVVVVGHGKTPEGRQWGEVIDLMPNVIRMWNWHWQLQGYHDYGNKFDYGYYEISRTEMARFQKHVCTKPSKSWVGARLKHKPYDGPLPEPTIIHPLEPHQELGMKMGGVGTKGRLVLSRGATVAGWALGCMAPGSTLYLVGFDNVYHGHALKMEEGFPYSYIECPAGFPFRDYPEKVPVSGVVSKYGNHDYAVEGPLLKVLAEQAGVKLVHAQDVW